MKASRFLLSIALMFIMLTAAQASAADTGPAKKVVFLPFAIHAAQDLSYLREGIRDMLGSRLAADAGIMVVDKALVGQALATAGDPARPDDFRTLARQLQADYLVAGSVTSLGASMSIDATVYEAASNDQAQTFYATAENQDRVIPAINGLAGDIASQVFSAGPRQSSRAGSAPAPAAPAPAPAAQPANQTAHPDRAFLAQGSAPGGNTALVRPQAITSPQGFTKSQNLDMNIEAMDIGDVDGDGIEDIVVADRKNVLFFHRQGSRLEQFGRIPLSASHKVHSISIADLNANGLAEIYFSSVDVRDPNSFAVEWSKGDFQYLFQEAPWYVRALNIPGEGMVLAGQRGGGASPVKTGIYQLIINNGILAPDRKLMVPDYLNLFDFAMADLNRDGQTEIVAISDSDRLLVLQANGRLLWHSNEYYGGTSRYIGEIFEREQTAPDPYGAAGESLGTEDKYKRIYIPSRIIITDLNNDGMDDVVINRNISTASRVTEKYKSFKSGEILGLTWNGISLTELWRTRKIDGYISDYQFKMTTADKNKAELHVGLVLQSGLLGLGSGDSTVLTYPLEFGEKN